MWILSVLFSLFCHTFQSVWCPILPCLFFAFSSSSSPSFYISILPLFFSSVPSQLLVSSYLDPPGRKLHWLFSNYLVTNNLSIFLFYRVALTFVQSLIYSVLFLTTDHVFSLLLFFLFFFPDSYLINDIFSLYFV